MRLLSTLALLAVISVPLSAQTCQLSTSGTLAPGSTFSIDLSDSLPNAMTFLVVGQTMGSTTISFGPIAGFTLDLDAPFIPLPMGMTDMNGDVSLSVDIPGMVPSLPMLTIHGQAVSIDFGFGGGGMGGGGMGLPMINTCVSNLITVNI